MSNVPGNSSNSASIAHLTALVQSLADNATSTNKTLERLKRKVLDSSDTDEDQVLSDHCKRSKRPKKTKTSKPNPSGKKQSSGTLPVVTVSHDGRFNREPEFTCTASTSCANARSCNTVPANSSRGQNAEPFYDNNVQPHSPTNATIDMINNCEYGNDLSLLERHDSDTDSSIEPNDEIDLGIPILSSVTDPTWNPPERSFEWFKKVADLELSDDQIQGIMADFVPSDEVNKHFIPPMFPPSIWNRIKEENSPEIIKHRVIFRSQKLLSSAMMPLMTVLDSLKKEDPNQKLLASAMQMICTSNLHLSRFRRSAANRFIKQELRQPLFSKSVTHLHLFGSDFDASAETAAKTQSSFQKVLVPAKTSKPAPKPASSTNQNFHRPSTSLSGYNDRPSSRYGDKSLSYPSHKDYQPGRGQSFRGYNSRRSSYRGRGYRPPRRS